MLKDSWKSVTMAHPIQWATLKSREKVVARGVATALRALIGGKALSCIRHHPEKLNGFEMWRLLYREYKPDTATRKVNGLWHEKGHGKGKSREKVKGKGKGKGREERQGGNRSVVTVVTVGNGVKPVPSMARGVVRCNLVQWCHIFHRLLFLTLDLLCRNVFKQ